MTQNANEAVTNRRENTQLLVYSLFDLCNNEFAVNGSAGSYFRHFQGLHQGHIQMFQNQRM